VKADGKMIMNKVATYSTSTGDEPGKGGCIVSQVNNNECEFMMYSFDVMVEGKNFKSFYLTES
jgi:Domain of unknown function (DUF4150)